MYPTSAYLIPALNPPARKPSSIASICSGSLIEEKFFHESSVATEMLAYRNKSMPNCLPDASHSERNIAWLVIQSSLVSFSFPSLHFNNRYSYDFFNLRNSSTETIT